MTGWKTWLAGLGLIGYGVGGAAIGAHSTDEAIQHCLEGLAILGVGHKIDKAARAFRGQ